MMMKLDSKSTVTMNDLLAQALGIKNRCKDIVLPGSHVGRQSKKRATGVINPGLTSATASLEGEYGTLNFLAPITTDENNTLSIGVSAKLTEWSLTQLCSIRLGVPASYMMKCHNSRIPDIQNLFTENLNTLMSHYGKGTRIRLYKPEDSEDLVIRGIVSDSYTVFDSYDVLEMIYSILGDQFSIKGYILNEEGLHLRVTTTEPLHVDGEDLYPGLILSSGDVGNSSLDVQFFIFKQVCTNGLVMAKISGKILHKRHLGSYNSEKFKEVLASALELFPVFCENAETLVKSARMKDMTEDDLVKRLEAFERNNVKLSEDEKEDITAMTFNYGMTLWGFINALTEFAQRDRFDLNNRLNIETYAGNLLTVA